MVCFYPLLLYVAYYLQTQSSPRAIIQILLTSTRILGKAFFEAGRQAVKSMNDHSHVFAFVMHFF